METTHLNHQLRITKIPVSSFLYWSATSHPLCGFPTVKRMLWRQNIVKLLEEQIDLKINKQYARQRKGTKSKQDQRGMRSEFGNHLHNRITCDFECENNLNFGVTCEFECETYLHYSVILHIARKTLCIVRLPGHYSLEYWGHDCIYEVVSFLVLIKF